MFSHIVVPAIYRFDWRGEPGLEKLLVEQEILEDTITGWGWQRAAELFEAANNTLAAKGHPRLSARQIAIAFSEVSPTKHRPPRVGCTLFFVTRDGEPKADFPSVEEWLAVAVEKDYYLPAKLGTELIKAIKKLKPIA